MTATTKVFDPTKPVQTRDGRPARIICTDKASLMDNSRTVIALVTIKYGCEVARMYHSDGKVSPYVAQFDDLVNVPVRTSTWENVYENTSGSMTYASKEKAKYNRSRMSRFLGLLRRDFEDGVFVSAEFEPLTSEE